MKRLLNILLVAFVPFALCVLLSNNMSIGLGENFSSNYLSSTQGSNDRGLFTGDSVKIQDQLYDRINWKWDNYFKFESGDNIPNYQDQRFYTNWDSTYPNTPPATDPKTKPDENPNPGFNVQCNLPNTGSLIYTRDGYGIDVLQNNLWNTQISSIGSNPLLEIINKNYTLKNNWDDVERAKSSNYINTYLNLGMDFGSNFGFNRLYDSTNTTNPESFNIYDDEGVLTNKIFSGVSTQNIGLNVPTFLKTDASSYNANKYYDGLKEDYFNGQYSKILPYYGQDFTVKKLNNETQSNKYYLGSFGINTSDGAFFTVTVEVNYQAKTITDSSYNEVSLIIDKNLSASTQQSELDDIFEMETSKSSDGQFKPYTDSKKRSFMDLLNGKNTIPLQGWGIIKRQAISTTNKNNFKANTSSSILHHPIPITSDAKSKAFPNADVNTGFNPESFTNSCIMQYWDNSNINNYATNISSYGFKSQFENENGYHRDSPNTEVKDKKYYTSTFFVSDCAFIYTTKFEYDCFFQNNIYNLGKNPTQWLQTVSAVQNPKYKNSIEEESFPKSVYFNKIYSSDDTKESYPIHIVFKSNNSLSKGGIAATVIILSFLLFALIYYLYNLNDKKKKKKIPSK